MTIRRHYGLRGIIMVLATSACARTAGATIEDQPPPNGCEQVRDGGTLGAIAFASSDFPPLQLEILTPFEPTAFQSAGRTYVIYELHFRNYARNSLTLRRLDVIDAEMVGAEPIATFESERLDELLWSSQLWSSGAQSASDESGNGVELAANEGVVALMCLAFDGDAGLPDRLSHRVQTDNGVAQGPIISTHYRDLTVIGPPVAGSNWFAAGAPSNDSHHRVALLIIDGRAQISTRYGIDWGQMEDGATFSGDELDNRSYHAFGEEVLAVADGTVVTVKDGFPDNVPRTAAGFRPAVPLTTSEAHLGNAIVIDLGGERFALYAHLQAGSLRVKEGDHVQRGQMLARIGSSGDSRQPHLHFHVATTPNLWAAEGVPYLIDQYRVKLTDDTWETRTRELPLRDMLIDFGQAQHEL